MTSGELRPDVGTAYRRSRLRLDAFLRGVDDEQWVAPVPACPGWRVRDVVAHLVGVVEDAIAGRIQGPPEPAQTAAEVDRHRSDPAPALLDQWSTMAPAFEEAITAGERWPAFFDVLSHEHDIGGALGCYGPRHPGDVELAARLLGEGLARSTAVTIDLGTHVIEPGTAERPTVRLTTTPFELFRARLGRRTRDQVLAFAWSADPGRILEELFVFGPAPEPFPD